MPKGDDGVCLVERRLAPVAGRFGAQILQALATDDAHFNALKRATGASAYTLARQLRGLGEAGLVVSHRESAWGRNVYRLTDSGWVLVGFLDRIATLSVDATPSAWPDGQDRE